MRRVSAYLAAGCAAAAHMVLPAASAEAFWKTEFEASEGFEPGALADREGWTLESGAARISSDESGGGQYLELSAGVDGPAELRIAAAVPEGAQVVFTDFILRLASDADGGSARSEWFADVRGALSGYLRVGAGGVLYVYDGGGEGAAAGWLETGERLGGEDGSGWTRITVRHDAAAGSWDLYVGGRMAAAGIALRGGEDAAAAAPEIVFTSGGAGAAHVDAIAASLSNPLFEDADGDGLPDAGSLASGGREGDPDGDGAVNVMEFVAGTDAGLADTDGDGVSDLAEFEAGTDPLSADDGARRSGRLICEIRRADATKELRAASLRTLRRSGVLQQAASESDSLERLESVRGREDHFVGRIRGYLVAPVSGDYVFRIAGDDQAELWLSDGEAPARARIAARVPGATGLREWDRYLSQKSAPVRLEAGERYFFEASHREFGGDDHLSVAWEVPGAEEAEIISAAHVEPFERMADDADGDLLPDFWESEKGLSAEEGAAGGRFGDPDGDGIENWREYQLGFEPMTADSEGRAGLARREVWTGVPGAYLVDLERFGGFPHAPAEIDHLSALEAPPSWDDQTGSRITALIRIPETGDYTFWVAGDDQAELRVSLTGDPAELRTVARTLGWTAYRDFSKYPEQRSEPLALAAGQLVLAELLHKDLGGEDHASAAWTRPGSGEPEVIGAGYLVSPEARAEDANGDRLADSWQQQTGLWALLAESEERWHEAGAYGDPDRDGLTNLRERELGTDPLAADAAGLQDQLLCEVWTEAPGMYVEDLVRREDFPGSPSYVRALEAIDYENLGEEYGVRLRGYLIAPADGDYVFSLAADNAAQLWLGEDESPFTRRLAAEVLTWSGRRLTPYGATASSRPIRMEAGRRYFLEILHKESDRADHLSLEWSGGGERLPQSVLVDRTRLQPFAGHPADADDDGLPDQWQQETGLAQLVSSYEAGSWGDPDRDLLDNFEEYRRGTDPLYADSGGLPGLASWEAWHELPGQTVDDLRSDRRFPKAPSERQFFKRLEPWERRGDRYGARMRGMIEAPVSGDYVFAIRADDAAEFWLGSGESKFSRRLAASIPAYSNQWEWDKYPEQVSAPVTLEQGERRFFEILHKEGAHGDHVAVAWKRPGSEEFEIVPGSAVLSFAPGAEDRDDDELPDDWERAHGLDPGDDGSLRASGGYWGDPDGDGLPNHLELALGTSPASSDSDGDGLGDEEEIHLTGTDPAKADDGLELEAAFSAPGGAASGTDGEWQADGEHLYAPEFGGAARWSFSLEKPGRHFARISLSVLPEPGRDSEILELSVDGILLGAYPAVTSAAGSRVSAALPYLTAGEHALEAVWRSPVRGRGIRLEKLEILALGSAPQAPAGSVDLAGDASLVSPAWIEGSAAFPSLVYAGGRRAHVLPGSRWGANAPLAEDGSLTPIPIGYENGLAFEEAAVRWASFNVFARRGEFRLRAGDSLRLTGFPDGEEGAGEGTVTIFVDGVATAAGSPLEPAVHSFVHPGLYEVRAEFESAGGTLHAASTTVRAVSASFGAEGVVRLYTGQFREVSLGGIGPEVVVDAAPELRWEELQSGEDGLRVRVFAGADGSYPLAARLGDGGPVIALARALSSRIAAAGETSMRVAETLPDGTVVIELDVSARGLGPHSRIRIRIVAPGVTFEDGSTEMWLTAEDFGEDGLAVVRFLRPPDRLGAVCHEITLFEGEEEVGKH